MATMSVNYSDSGNQWDVTIYWECEYGDTTAYAWYEVNLDGYGNKLFDIVERYNTSNRFQSGTVNVGGEYYLYIYRNGSYLTQKGPFTITEPDPPTYTVTYNANGGTGAPSQQTKKYNVSLTLSTTKPTKSNTYPGAYTVTLNANGGTCSTASLSAARTTKYTFSKWNTSSSGSGTSYSSGATYTRNANLYLYAIYTSTTTTAYVTLPTPTRNGYDFVGWGTSSTATSGKTGSYTPTGNVTLYAIWKAKGLVYIYDGSDYAAYQVYIYDGSDWNLYCPYVFDGSDWNMCT